MRKEIVEQHADITRLLLFHFQAPVAGGKYIRGVLPAPIPAEAVRVVIGGLAADTPDQVIAYEIPLRTGDDYLTAEGVIGILRALEASTHFFPSDSVSVVMGMTLVRVDPTALAPAASTSDDSALTILRTITYPYTEDQPDLRLLGFLFLIQDRLRLYLDTDDIPGVIGVDVRPSGAITALLAALPSLITEKERIAEDGTDPHCSSVVDLTDW